MKAKGGMLVLLVLVLALGFFLVAVNPGHAGDQPLVLAQRAAPAVPPVAAPAPEMEQRRPAASAPSPAPPPRMSAPPPAAQSGCAPSPGP